MTLEQNVAAVLDEHRMLDRGRRVAVAVSGGADSVFLLHVLHATGLAAAVLHVNHQLRGEESVRDQEFVRELAGSFGLPFHLSNSPVGEGNIEQEARTLRYSFFARQLLTGYCDSVATGHTLDDQAETVFARFLRGSGTAGLSGIRPVTDAGIVRPLLKIRREELREWLRKRKIPWLEDCSNLDTAFLRNQLRLKVLPELLALNPSLPEVLSSTAERAMCEESYWIEEVGRVSLKHLVIDGEAVLIEMGSFFRLHPAVRRRLLRHAIEIVRGSLRGIEFRHTEAILNLMNSTEGSGRIQLPDLDIYRSFDWLRFASVGYDTRLERNFQTPLLVPGCTEIPERLLSVEMELVTCPRVYNEQVDAFDAGRCAGSLVLRNWRPGDSYCPRGKSHAEKIKTLFQSARIPLWQRRNWPVIASGDTILWARQFGPAHEFAARPDSDTILLIRERGESKLLTRESNNQVNMERQRAQIRQQHSLGQRGAEVL